MEKNNSNQNNGENFLTNINHNFEKNILIMIKKI